MRAMTDSREVRSLPTWREVRHDPARWTEATARRLGRSSDPKDRQEALVVGMFLARAEHAGSALLDWAEAFIDDENNECRWLAWELVRVATRNNPDRAWELVQRYSTHEDRDMRMAVACVVLEHLIDEHADVILPRVGARLSDPLFLDTALNCWVHGEARARLAHLIDVALTVDVSPSRAADILEASIRGVPDEEEEERFLLRPIRDPRVSEARDRWDRVLEECYVDEPPIYLSTEGVRRCLDIATELRGMEPQ